jgi:hypothetical protein
MKNNNDIDKDRNKDLDKDLDKDRYLNALHVCAYAAQVL